MIYSKAFRGMGSLPSSGMTDYQCLTLDKICNTYRRKYHYQLDSITALPIVETFNSLECIRFVYATTPNAYHVLIPIYKKLQPRSVPLWCNT